MVGKSVEDNLRVAAAFEEAFNVRDWPRLKELLAVTIVVHDPASPEPIEGKDAVISMFTQNVDYFPSARIESVRLFGQGDLVCSVNSEMGGPEGSDRVYRTETCYVFRVAEGRISEIRFFYDALLMMQQIGLSLGS